MSADWRMRWIAAWIFVAGVIFVAGCGGKDANEKLGEKMMERTLENTTGEKTDVDIDGEDVSIKTGDGRVDMKTTSQWPSDMFADVPRCAFGRIERVTSATEEGMRKFNVWLRDVPDDATEEYDAELKARGFESQMSTMGPNANMLSAQKGKIAVQFMHGKQDKTGVLVAFEVNE